MMNYFSIYLVMDLSPLSFSNGKGVRIMSRKTDKRANEIRLFRIFYVYKRKTKRNIYLHYCKIIH
ncbi:uncharacterized protein BX663DRAFT_505668 [Cokeromyces recurvatus]|uniref:uncharacterized protein n=1 Tax=Cokeromyces recurvatus TaxID=90255 RepID=UPI00221E4F42|nr:uncharacterized protein BX663DRAFT_505668 [Cokeromyces recurvatus]KAI7903911.1 hypothetical protein BX663DRAFT_505668 [Cokeromyces recurvatus]